MTMGKLSGNTPWCGGVWWGGVWCGGVGWGVVGHSISNVII